MEQKNNAICAVCGKGYYMCMSCKETKDLHPWKLHTDTSEHYKIYQILRGYTTGKYNKSEAKERLQNVNLSDLNTLNSNIQKAINDIMKFVEKDIEIKQVSTDEEKISNMKSEKSSKSKKSCNRHDE